MSNIAGINRNQMSYSRVGNQVNNQLNKTSNRLSSGKRINSAADDAAGLAISKKIEKELRGLNSASDNISTGMNAMNVGDGALAGVMDYLQDIREVSIRAMNGTYSDSDRQAMQQQINGDLDGINQMARGTQFNTQSLLDGSMATMDIASNPSGTSGIRIQMADSTLQGLGIAGYSVMGGNINLNAIDNAIAMVSDARSKMGASTNGMEHALRVNQIAAENQTAAQSRIEDQDMAKGISEQKKNQALQNYQFMIQKKQMSDGGIVARMFS